jgi:hypothetical protein
MTQCYCEQELILPQYHSEEFQIFDLICPDDHYAVKFLPPINGPNKIFGYECQIKIDDKSYQIKAGYRMLAPYTNIAIRRGKFGYKSILELSSFIELPIHNNMIDPKSLIKRLTSLTPFI